MTTIEFPWVKISTTTGADGKFTDPNTPKRITMPVSATLTQIVPPPTSSQMQVWS